MTITQNFFGLWVKINHTEVFSKETWKPTTLDASYINIKKY